MEKRDTKKYDFDIVVVGGGPAGIMAALMAAKLGGPKGFSVALIEKNKQLGKKLLLTGNGRCNITNAEFNLKKLVENYGKGGEFLFHAFSVFGPKETINFFEKLGIKTKIENDNRVFPADGNATDVLNVLEKYLLENKINISFNSSVSEIILEDSKIDKLILKENDLGKKGEITARKYIICTGGKSYSPTGSDGSGYKFAEKMGHKIVSLTPALSPIKVKEEWIKDIQGISLKGVGIKVLLNNKKYFSDKGEIIFTHFGVSGPAILDISSKVGESLERGETKISFDLFPLLSQEEVLKEFEDILRRYPNRAVKNVLSFFVPERLAGVLSDITKIKRDKIANNMSKIEKILMSKTIKNFEFNVKEIFDFNQALVTRGGVSLKEIDHKTMKSKIVDNLFFAGEIIDIDGRTGGFNLQSCWSTGYLAGKSSVE